jgi:hypothetical protein
VRYSLRLCDFNFTDHTQIIFPPFFYLTSFLLFNSHEIRETANERAFIVYHITKINLL